MVKVLRSEYYQQLLAEDGAESEVVEAEDVTPIALGDKLYVITDADDVEGLKPGVLYELVERPELQEEQAANFQTADGKNMDELYEQENGIEADEAGAGTVVDVDTDVDDVDDLDDADIDDVDADDLDDDDDIDDDDEDDADDDVK